MIFDSAAMQKLRDRYAGEPDFCVPRIVSLDRCDDLSGEREYLEQLVGSVRQSKQEEWLRRMVRDDEGQHWGAWFEIYLYGWLQEIGVVQVEPDVAGCSPDFLLHSDQAQIGVEAQAVLVSDTEREQERRRAEIRWRFSKIRLPYIVGIRERAFGPSLDVADLQSVVGRWLGDDPFHSIRYQDEHGNRLVLDAQRHLPLEHVETVHTNVAWVSPEPLRPVLHKKAKQHKALRKAGCPYVVAVLLLSHLYSAEEVTEAWFGRTEVIVDLDSEQVIGDRADGSGLHFFRSGVRHRSVSGTLVFKASFDRALGRHRLRTWYIQNPYARTPIGNDLFPAEGRFVVAKRSVEHISMDWRAGP